MSQSLAKIYVHITFSTKYRQHLIDKEISEQLYKYLGGICKELECFPVQIGGFTDHIHVLCLLSKKIPAMKLLEELKKSSSKWVKSIDPKYSNFYLQDGYGIFSVNPAEIDVVKNYILTQEKHHTKKSFQEEYRAFLEKYMVDYDERYVWD